MTQKILLQIELLDQIGERAEEDEQEGETLVYETIARSIL
jgi:hypothetical protein